ncbi:unnamed protein product [Paramecium primaurelia]|uniref:Uncharacterized protein n=1 Tax=Paramecium primaurelia TaxID=5886 RepID=A0A8S1P3U3_PARPR|nr:unnamed protein product [Paramecium primaurelia]
MQNVIQRRCCQHDQDILAVNIGQDNKDGNKYFCPQCLIKLINSKELILMSQAKIEIQTIKNQISQNIEEQCKQKLSLMNNLQNNIIELQCPLNQFFTQINEEIDQLKNQTQSLYQQSQIIASETENLDQDLKLLIDEKSDLLTSQEYDQQLKKQVLFQLKLTDQSRKLQDIISEFDKISQLISNECFNIQKNPQSQDTKAKEYLCKSHQEDIELLLIDEKNKVQKFACIQCVSEKQGRYLTLEQLEQSFSDYQQQSEKSLRHFQQLKNQQISNSISMLRQAKENYTQNINQYIKQLEESSKSFENIIHSTLQFKDQNIFKLEQDQLLQILEPVYLNQSPNHYFQIINNSLEQDSQLYINFEYSMKELITLQFQNSNQIFLEQLRQRFLLKSLVNKIKEQNENNKFDYLISGDSCNQANFIFENQINNFLFNKMQMCIQYEQFVKNFENRNKLSFEQVQLNQNLTEEQNKLKQQYNNCEQGNEMYKMNLEKKIIYLESLKTKINSINFCNQIQNEIQIQTDETIQSMERKIKQYEGKIFQLEKEKDNLNHPINIKQQASIQPQLLAVKQTNRIQKG